MQHFGSILAFLFLVSTVWAGSRAVVLEPVTNMYSGASADTDVVSQAIFGSNLEVLESKDGWSKVRTADEYTGWVREASFRRLKEGDPDYASKGKTAQVESIFASLYREPDVTKHQPMLTLPFESRLEVVAEPEQNTRWLQVRLPDDRSAWVQRGDLTLSVRTLSIDQAIALAKRFQGLPYLWGGTSSFGYDCSGYMQMLCRRRGISLPRDAGPQARSNVVVAVEKKDLQPGDLLYFGSSEKRITHTGMYIGNGEFIHATTHEHPVIQISRLGDEYWTKLLVACRRPK